MDRAARTLTPRLEYAPMYFIAICAKRALPERLAALSLFGDRDESVYAHYDHEVRKNMDAGGRIAELEAEIERLQAQSIIRDVIRIIHSAPTFVVAPRHLERMSTEINYRIDYGTVNPAGAGRAHRSGRAAVRVRGRRRRIAVEQRMHLPDAAHRRYARDDVSGAAGARPVPRIPFARRAHRAHPDDDSRPADAARRRAPRAREPRRARTSRLRCGFPAPARRGTVRCRRPRCAPCSSAPAIGRHSSNGC